MPRIPRRSEGNEEAPPEDQRTLSSGDPLAPAPAEPSEAEAAPESPAPSPPAENEEQPTVAAPPVEPTDPATTGDPAPTAEPAAPAEAATAVHPVAADPLPAPLQPIAATGEVGAETGEQAPADARPRFRQRTRMRRRLRYLRRLRELAFRDLGGLVFDLHRFGRDRNDLVTAKLEALANIDRELRALQDGLHDRRDFTDLREAGIAACPRCGTLHDTDANFCPGCGSTLRSVLVREAFPVTVTPAEGQEPEQQPAGPDQPASSS